VDIFWLPDLLIGCFDFILDLCIFLKMVRCQFMSGGQKTPPYAMTEWQLLSSTILPIYQESACYTVLAETMGFLPSTQILTPHIIKKNTQM
jgi:hypothetical protein